MHFTIPHSMMHWFKIFFLLLLIPCVSNASQGTEPLHTFISSSENTRIATKNASKKSKKLLRQQSRAHKKLLKTQFRKIKEGGSDFWLAAVFSFMIFTLSLWGISHLLGGMLTFGQAALWVLGGMGVITLLMIVIVLILFRNGGIQMCRKANHSTTTST